MVAVEIWTAVTCVPGTTAPVGSVVVPEIAAVFLCPKTGRERQNATAKIISRRRIQPPSDSLYCGAQVMSSKESFCVPFFTAGRMSVSDL